MDSVSMDFAYRDNTCEDLIMIKAYPFTQMNIQFTACGIDNKQDTWHFCFMERSSHYGIFHPSQFDK